jgi:biopolymer transport protein ExbD/biopolymer transport protein TolR
MPVNVEHIKKQKAPPPVADINVTPMVDVMLVMLIIFMVITPMLSKGKDVDMVKTKNAISMQAADKTDAIICAVTRDGKTYLNVTQMEPSDMPQRVKELLEKRPTDKTIFIKADYRAKYDRVVDLVDNLRAVGVDQLGLLTEQRAQDSLSPTTPTTPPASK